MNIKRTPGPRGIKTILTYWYRGTRYRPTIGYDLPADRERETILQYIQAVHDEAHAAPAPTTLTFAAFVPTYLQRMRLKGRTTTDWAKRYVIDRHLVPHFGHLGLSEIRLIHGENYIERRRALGAAAGTIERECNVLSALMNCAVEHEHLAHNRLRNMTVPQGARRARIASPDELTLLLAKADANVAAAILIAINTGLREGKIAEIDQAWIRLLEDGPWLFLPKPRTPTKGNPDQTPLNRYAADALKRDITYLHGRRVFDNWQTGGKALSQAFTKLTQRCGITDLHFHDLRHTFSTALENLDIGERTIDLLMGHKIQGTGERYRHGGPGRDKKLRDAVMALEHHWHQVPLKVPLKQKAMVAT